MRRSILIATLVCLGACNDDNETEFAGDASTAGDAAARDAGPDAAPERSLLPRPGALEHAPTVLPDDLKPPR